MFVSGFFFYAFGRSAPSLFTSLPAFFLGAVSGIVLSFIQYVIYGIFDFNPSAVLLKALENVFFDAFLPLIFAGNRPLSPAGSTAKAQMAYRRMRNKSSALPHRRKAGRSVCPGDTVASRRHLKKRLAKCCALVYTFSAAEVVELVDTLS